MFSVVRYTGIMFLTCLVMMAGACAKQPSAPGVPQAKPASSASDASDPKKLIVASVNGTELTLDALLKMMNSLPPKSDVASESTEERKQRALDALVLRELAFQQSLSHPVAVDPKSVDWELFNYKQDLGGEKEYTALLAKEKLTEDEVRSRLERDLIINIVYNREVTGKVAVPDVELKAYYEKEKQKLIKKEKVAVIELFLLKDEGKTSKKKAKELLTKIKADKEQNPWNLVLDGTFMVQNHVINKQKEPELYETARKMKPQQLSGIIRTSNGILHIIKLKEFSPERSYTFEEAKDSIKSRLMGPYVEKRTREWENEMKADAKIVIYDNPVQQKTQSQK